MPIIPPEIQKMMDQIKEWQIGAGIFKPDTPADIIEMDQIVMQWFADIMDDVQ